MVTGDGKWVTYDNFKRNQLWSNRGEMLQTVGNAELTVRKGFVGVWCDWQEIVYYELLPYSNLYCQQLDCLMEAIVLKRPVSRPANRRGIVFHQNNARPHTTIVGRQNLREIGWDILMLPPYSLDIDFPQSDNFIKIFGPLLIFRSYW